MPAELELELVITRRASANLTRNVTGGIEFLNGLNHHSALLEYELARVEQVLDGLPEFGAGGAIETLQNINLVK